MTIINVSEKSIDFPLNVYRKDNSYYYSFEPQGLTQSGDVSSAGSANTMNTQKKRHNRRKSLTTMLKNLPGVIYCCRTDKDRTMDFVSEGCYSLTGYLPADLINNNKIAYGQLIHPEDQKTVWDESQAALAENRTFRLHYRIKTAHGVDKWVWEMGRKVIDPEGNGERLDGFIIDFTDYRQTEEELFKTTEELERANAILLKQSKKLKRSLKELRVLFEASRQISSSLSLSETLDAILDLLIREFRPDSCSIRLLDDDGVLRIKNQRGLSSAFVTFASRKPTTDCHSGECYLSNKVIIVNDAEKVKKVISTNLEVGEGIQSFGLAPIAIEDEVMGVLACASKERKGFFTEEYAELLKTLGQQCALAIRNARLYEKTKDFSEQLEIEIEKRREELQEKSRLLSQSEKLAALGEMADRVAHETRNPLVTIGGFARRIHRRLAADDPLKADAALIIKEVERLERMVYWITEYRKYISADFQPANVNVIVDEALNAVGDKVKEKAIRIEKDLLSDPPLVKVDSKNMVFVFVNLFENGIEAMDVGGTLRVTTRADQDGSMEVIVSDTGKGIEEKDLESIYNPFYTSKMSGAGMGLTITHKIVKDHHGFIKVHSEVGKGTTFVVQLPAIRTTRNEDRG